MRARSGLLLVKAISCPGSRLDPGTTIRQSLEIVVELWSDNTPDCRIVAALWDENMPESIGSLLDSDGNTPYETQLY